MEGRIRKLPAYPGLDTATVVRRRIKRIFYLVEAVVLPMWLAVMDLVYIFIFRPHIFI